MDRQHLMKAAGAALSEVLEREVTGLTEATRLFEDLHLDSTSVLELLMALEDAMGLEVDPEDLDMDDFATVGTLLTYLESQPDATAPTTP
ncbi:acyl carrier protein [Streptomyces sp. NPDC057743]|uniref:acyl carrier protein n=1 Tax=Streptomyces sp. NPDC057743 TaxID=3346236 RepID=UPI0036805BB5